MRIKSGEGVEPSQFLYRSLNIVRVNKSKRLKWVGHVARMEEGGVLSQFQQVNLQKRDLQEGLGLDGG